MTLGSTSPAPGRAYGAVVTTAECSTRRTISISAPSAASIALPVRSTQIRTTEPAPKPIIVTATREGLKTASVQIVPARVAVSDGIATFMPQHLPVSL